MKLLSTMIATVMLATSAHAYAGYVVETDFGDGHAAHVVEWEPNQPDTDATNDIQFFVRSYVYWDDGREAVINQRITWEFDGWKSGSVTEHSGPRQRLLFEELENLIPQDYSWSTADNYNFDAAVRQLDVLTNGRGWEAYSRAIAWTRDAEYIDGSLLVEDHWGETLMNVIWAMYGLRWDSGNWVFESYDELHDMRHVILGTSLTNPVIDGSFPRNLNAHNEEVRYRSFDEDRMDTLNTHYRHYAG